MGFAKVDQDSYQYLKYCKFRVGGKVYMAEQYSKLGKVLVLGEVNYESGQ